VGLAAAMRARSKRSQPGQRYFTTLALVVGRGPVAATHGQTHPTPKAGRSPARRAGPAPEQRKPRQRRALARRATCYARAGSAVRSRAAAAVVRVLAAAAARGLKATAARVALVPAQHRALVVMVDHLMGARAVRAGRQQQLLPRLMALRRVAQVAARVPTHPTSRVLVRAAS